MARSVKRDDIQFPAKHSALRDDVHVLGALVGDVLKEQGGEALFDWSKRIAVFRSAVEPATRRRPRSSRYSCAAARRRWPAISRAPSRCGSAP